MHLYHKEKCQSSLCSRKYQLIRFWGLVLRRRWVKKISLNFIYHHFYCALFSGKREVPCQQYSYTPLLGPLAARGSQAMMMKSMRVSHLPRVFFLSRGFLTHHLQLECCGSAGPLDWVLSVHNGYTLNTKVAPPNSYHDQDWLSVH